MEQRSFVRIPFDVFATIVYGDTKTNGRVQNLSLNGAFIETRLDVPEGIDVEIFIRLGDKSDGPRIHSRANVVRSHPDGIGVEFSRTDLESFAHLEQLIASNVGDPERVLEEYQAYLARGGRS